MNCDIIDDKPTNNEIIKALKRMIEEDPDGFSADILDLINRQKAEIERLKALAENGASAIDTNNRLIQKIAETTAEAIKEFADKAVEKLTENYSSKYCRWIDDTIDSLLKEMEEEEE